jgi:hypothetical protein
VAITSKIQIRARPNLTSAESPRQRLVEFLTRDGRTLSNHVVKVRGVMENPMTTDEVFAKALELFSTALPAERAKSVVEAVLNLDTISEISDLVGLVNPA